MSREATLTSLSPWTMSSESMDSVDFVRGTCPVCLDSLDFVQGVHGQYPDCPLSLWTMSTESVNNANCIHGHCPVWLVPLDFVHGLTGLCPECPWTFSTESMVNVHWVHGKSQVSPWTFYRLVYFYNKIDRDCAESWELGIAVHNQSTFSIVKAMWRGPFLQTGAISWSSPSKSTTMELAIFPYIIFPGRILGGHLWCPIK